MIWFCCAGRNASLSGKASCLLLPLKGFSEMTSFQRGNPKTKNWHSFRRLGSQTSVSSLCSLMEVPSKNSIMPNPFLYCSKRSDYKLFPVPAVGIIQEIFKLETGSNLFQRYCIGSKCDSIAEPEPFEAGIWPEDVHGHLNCFKRASHHVSAGAFLNTSNVTSCYELD